MLGEAEPDPERLQVSGGKGSPAFNISGTQAPRSSRRAGGSPAYPCCPVCLWLGESSAKRLWKELISN